MKIDWKKAIGLTAAVSMLDIANTVHLLSEDMNLPIDQEQTVAIESDEVVHSPTQDQDTDCHQENSD